MWQSKNMRPKKKALIAVGILFFLLLWTIVLLYIGPEMLVAKLGVQNGFLLVFLLASLGGVSVFTGAPYYVTLVTLAIGGLNPFLLGLIAGTGAAIGDSVFYYLGLTGKYLLPEKFDRKIERVRTWLNRGPRWAIPVGVYVYTGLTPLPQDVMMLAVALTQAKYKWVLLAMWLGNITLATIIAIFAVQGISLFI